MVSRGRRTGYGLITPTRAGLLRVSQARLDEMQAQYDRLLSEIDDSKRAAQQEVYRAFDDDAPVIPAGGVPGSPTRAGSPPNVTLKR